MNTTQTLPPVACDRSAIRDVKQYRALSDQFRASILGCAELPDGYSYTLKGELLTLKTLGEWMELERRCCPFLNFELSVSGTDSRWWLTLTGPEGAKAILEREFGV